MKYLTIIAFLALATTACEGDKAPDTKKPATSKPTTAATTKKSATKVAKTGSDEEKADPAMDKEDIPVAADFEEKAQKEITEKNLEAEFSKLEKEVKGE